MKLLKTTLIALLSLSALGSNAWANPIDDEQNPRHLEKKMEREMKHNPMVFILNSHQDDRMDIIEVKRRALERYARTMASGYNSVGMPNFMLSDRRANAIFAIGGYAELRTAYDMGGRVDNLDFVTYDIPTMYDPANRQGLLMDASTSRLYFKSVIATNSLGPIESYIETDFRGYDNSLRLREAYVKFLGLTFGQTTTTFCDPNATFNTIDFEGPNAYTYRRNLMIRYQMDMGRGWSMGAALEMPHMSATYGMYSDPLPQRVFDIPLYFQYSWNKHSHVRASGILRTMNYYDYYKMEDRHNFGWGAQLSTSSNISDCVRVFGMAVYGEGIANYIQDLQGVGMDMAPSTEMMGEMNTPPAMAWFAGAQVNITERLPMTVGYSQVRMYSGKGKNMLMPTDYKLGQYVVTNIFYKFTRSLSAGAEYLYGTRHNFDGDFGKASRLQMAVRLNF